MRVQRHGHAQLRVGRAVAEEVGIGLVVTGRVAALEFVHDVLGVQDRLTPLISWVSGPMTPLTFLVSIWLVAGDAVRDVTAGVPGHQRHLVAEHPRPPS